MEPEPKYSICIISLSSLSKNKYSMFLVLYLLTVAQKFGASLGDRLILQCGCKSKTNIYNLKLGYLEKLCQVIVLTRYNHR